MHRKRSMEVFATSLLASLGLTQVVGCGGKATDGARRPSDAGANDSMPAAGGANGIAGAAGNASGGGASPGRAGSVGAGGRATSAGTGGIGGSAGDGGMVETESGAGAPRCVRTTPELGIDGRPTGYDVCEGGSVHRPSATTCPSHLPTAFECPPEAMQDGSFSGCRSDADCTGAPHGSCGLYYGFQLSCQCTYGCRTDDDCASGEICRCGDPIGQCVPASCRTDADCASGGSGFLCLSYSGPCGSVGFACQARGDECASNADCPGTVCGLVNSVHACTFKQVCVDGRPFLVGGAARVAPVARRTDWQSSATPVTAELDAGDRAALGARWTEIALMEHASIAAFARFALELLSLGAPPELVLWAERAIGEETAHARDAFALASAYLDRPVGPGVLDVSGSLAARSPLDIVRSTILEGCIGETVAALEAGEALRTATDPAVRAVLSRVVVEETSHAELAYRFVQWVLAHGAPELAAAIEAELVGLTDREARLAGSSAQAGQSRSSALVDHGVLDEATRAAIRVAALRDVVVPCARTLAASHGRPAVTPSSSPTDSVRRSGCS